MIKKNLRFVEIENKGKTKVFEVFSNHSNDFLGLIHWRNGWRCYVMSYNEVDMSRSCSKELDLFIEKLEEERKII